jgi:hypothetical protein
MSSYVEAAKGYSKGDSERECDFCGCKFRLIVPGQKGHEEPEEYSCPECGKEWRTRASLSPRVIELSDRTDGRSMSHAKWEAQNQKDG